MSQYTFNLEKVLEWREGEENDLTNRMAKKKQEVEEYRIALETVAEEYREEKMKRLKLSSGDQVYTAQLYESKLDEEIQRYNRIIDALQKEIEAIRNELVEARKQTKTMEKLKEKDYASFQEKMKHREQKFLDEVGTSGFLGFHRVSK